MRKEAHDFLGLVRQPYKFGFFLLRKLPAAFFSGVRVREMDQNVSVVTVPYKWFSQNPFHSTYFACLAMAAELSTGLLALLHTYHRDPPVSMLVIKLEAEYFKKATGLTTFTCRDGVGFMDSIERAVATRESVTFRSRSVGADRNGEKIAEFLITWSFRVKK
jgi:hypothetical protein